MIEAKGMSSQEFMGSVRRLLSRPFLPLTRVRILIYSVRRREVARVESKWIIKKDKENMSGINWNGSTNQQPV